MVVLADFVLMEYGCPFQIKDQVKIKPMILSLKTVIHVNFKNSTPYFRVKIFRIWSPLCRIAYIFLIIFDYLIQQKNIVLPLSLSLSNFFFNQKDIFSRFKYGDNC